MDESHLVAMLRALAHPTRLRIVNLLARGSGKMPAGDIAAALNVRRNTLSSHLAALTQCGLLVGHRLGRQIFYTIEMAHVRQLTLHAMTTFAGLPPGEAEKLANQVFWRLRGESR